MTTLIIHGPPGSSKTATAVSKFIIPALLAGRTVVTNIRGCTVENINSALSGSGIKSLPKQLPDDSRIILVPLNSDGYSRLARFFHWAPDGCLLVLDEVQKIFPKSIRDASIYNCVPPRNIGSVDSGEVMTTINDAFDQHRHLNWDIVCTCPSISQVAPFIRDVVESAKRQASLKSLLPRIVRRIFGFSDYKSTEHIATSNGFVSTYIIGTESFDIPDYVFKCYQSTATGKFSDGLRQFEFKKKGKFNFVLFFVLVLLFVSWLFSSNLGDDSVNDSQVVDSSDQSDIQVSQVYSFENSSRDFSSHNVWPINQVDDPFLSYLSSFKYFSGSIHFDDYDVFFINDDFGNTLVSTELFSVGVVFNKLSDNFISMEYRDYYRVLVPYSPPDEQTSETGLKPNISVF